MLRGSIQDRIDLYQSCFAGADYDGVTAGLGYCFLCATAYRHANFAKRIVILMVGIGQGIVMIVQIRIDTIRACIVKAVTSRDASLQEPRRSQQLRPSH